MTTRRRATLFITIAAVILSLPLASTARAATSKQVDDAIEKAIAYIYSKQTNGNWEEKANGEGGETAIATYALLAAGQNPKDERIQKAVAYLVQCDSNKTYSISLRCQVWLNLPQPYKPEIKQAFLRDEALLLVGAHEEKALGSIPSAFYGYECISGSGWDHSNSQYGVLGMWACAQAGIEISNTYWQKVDAGWRAQQFSNGGWGYISVGPQLPAPNAPEERNQDPQPRASMTAAGVATLFITDDYLHGMDGIDCRGNLVDPNIEAGLKWLGQDFDKEVYKQRVFYALYGVERVGVASGRKYLGTVDWYQNGAEYLVKHQNAEGGWSWHSVPDTAFGLLFLVRGRAPVVMNKLEYDINMHGDKAKVANWNQRPRDAANITKFIGIQNERPLNWQIVNLKVPVEDLHDAPILYIAGNQALDFTDEEIAKLRQYVEEGGVIFANADCASNSFTQGIHHVAKKLFPAYEFRDLPQKSPIFTNEQFMRNKWHGWPKLEALTNGARELIILEPTHDPARFWQTQAYGGHEELHQFFDDIFLYTVDRGEKGGLANKGETYIVSPDPAIKANKTITIARLEFPGNWDPEPGAWRRLAAILHNTEKTDLAITPVKLGEGTLDKSYKVAHLTGTFKFSLTAAARDAIKTYVESGGTLIVDACGGDAEFAQSAEKEIAAIFSGSALPEPPLTLDSPAFALGPKLEKVNYRWTARKVVGQLRTPRIRGLTINGRLAVFFSGEDLSCGMVGMHTDGIYGYEPESATALMEKLVLFASK